MLEITIGNCYKQNLETIIDPNNGQYFWITRRDLEIESKRNWQAILDKCKDSSRQKLAPNITFQPSKIFARNVLFEKIIKSCKTNNLEFLNLKKNQVYAFMKSFVMNKSLFQRQKKFLRKKNFYTAGC